MVKTDATKTAYVHLIANALRRYGLSSDVRLYIGCQFALESDFGNSSLAKRYCNHCGMKAPLIRLTTCLNKGGVDNYRGFAHYSGLADCVLDYILWCQYNRISSHAQKDVVAFEKFLTVSMYCPEPDYTDKINKLFLTFK